jgi:hypothetical protein
MVRPPTPLVALLALLEPLVLLAPLPLMAARGLVAVVEPTALVLMGCSCL